MRGLITQILTAASIAGAANAAPWTQAEGDWYGRALVARDTLDGAEGWRADLYGEYGISDRWTLTAKSEAVTYPDFSEFDREALRLSIRRQLLERGNWTLGAEAAVLDGSTATGLVSCEGFGAEARAGLGYSGQSRQGRPFYYFADAALIRQQGGCERWRAEIGYGADLTDRVFLTQQIWIEEGNQSASSIKTESQLGVHFGPVDVSLGYREETGGQFEETAVLIAVVARR
jgi:hypothetical protein